MYWIKHFFRNLKQISLLPVGWYQWDDSRMNLRWRDLVFCSVGLWKWLISEMLHGEEVPRGVILLGGWTTRKEMMHINEVAKSLGLDEVARNLLNDPPPTMKG